MCPPPQMRSVCLTHHGPFPSDKIDTEEACFPVQLTQPQGSRRSLVFCSNCGSSSHNSRAQNCPAWGQTCRNCLKKGQFFQLFTSLKYDNQQLLRKHHRSDNRLPLMTALKSDMYQWAKQLLGHVHLPLQQSCISLCGYNSSKITMLGVLHVPVRYGSKHLPSFPSYIRKSVFRMRR